MDRMCVPPFCAAAGGLKVGVEAVMVTWQAVCGAGDAGGGLVVCYTLQALPHPAGTSREYKLLSVLRLGFVMDFLSLYFTALFSISLPDLNA